LGSSSNFEVQDQHRSRQQPQSCPKNAPGIVDGNGLCPKIGKKKKKQIDRNCPCSKKWVIHILSKVYLKGAIPFPAIFKGPNPKASAAFVAVFATSSSHWALPSRALVACFKRFAWEDQFRKLGASVDTNYKVPSTKMCKATIKEDCAPPLGLLGEHLGFEQPTIRCWPGGLRDWELGHASGGTIGWLDMHKYQRSFGLNHSKMHWPISNHREKKRWCPLCSSQNSEFIEWSEGWTVNPATCCRLATCRAGMAGNEVGECNPTSIWNVYPIYDWLIAIPVVKCYVRPCSLQLGIFQPHPIPSISSWSITHNIYRAIFYIYIGFALYKWKPRWLSGYHHS